MYQIRSSALVLQRLVDPMAGGSALATVDSLYPMQKVSTWARSYLRAAVEHLGFWADIVAPYEFEPGAVRNVAFRPYLLLGRAGLEAAAHGLWLLTSESDDECISRHVRLMHRDFNLHRTALRAGGEDYSLVDELISDLEIRAAGLSPRAQPERVAAELCRARPARRQALRR